MRAVEAGQTQRAVCQRLQLQPATLRAWLDSYGGPAFEARRNRVYSPALKRQIVEQLLAGMSYAEAQAKYGVRHQRSLREWLAAHRATVASSRRVAPNSLTHAGDVRPPARAEPRPAGAGSAVARPARRADHAARSRPLADRGPAHAARLRRNNLRHRDPKKDGGQAVTMMRQRFPALGLETLCRLFGRTSSAYYEQLNRTAAQVFLAGLVLSLVAELRAGLPMLGTRKLLHLLPPAWVSTGARSGATTCLICWPPTGSSFATTASGWSPHTRAGRYSDGPI